MLDPTAVSNALQSSKAKDRNDALSTLEAWSPSSANLNSKQFAALVTGLFRCIEMDAPAWARTKSHPLELRLSKASNLVVSLVAACVDGRLPGVTLKAKHCFSIVHSIAGTFFVEDEIVHPVALDLVSVMLSLLRESFVVDYLQQDQWTRVSRFLVKLVASVDTDLMVQHGLTAMLYILKTSEPDSVAHLVGHYRELLPIIKNAAERKESVITVLLRIINKLAVVLSTQDVLFVHQLIAVAVRIFIQHHNTPSASLRKQLMVFLNLEALHDFISVEHLPRLVGPDDDSNSFHVYNVGILLRHLIPKLTVVDYLLDENDLAYLVQPHPWFGLSTFALASENTDGWLLHVGTARLLHTYYNIKHLLSPRLKRQRLDDLAEKITNLPSPLHFLEALVSDSPGLALPLAAFYFDMFPVELDDNDSPDESALLGSLTKRSLFRTLMGALDTHVSIWSLLALTCFIRHSTSDQCHNQLIKVCLPLIKSSLFCTAACLTVYICAPRCSDASVFDDVIDLPEANGPFRVTNESLRFWYAVRHVYRDIASPRRMALPRAIVQWLLGKWGAYPRELPEFIAWLAKTSPKQALRRLPAHAPERYSRLMAFISLRRVSVARGLPPLEVPPLETDVRGVLLRLRPFGELSLAQSLVVFQLGTLMDVSSLEAECEVIVSNEKGQLGAVEDILEHCLVPKRMQNFPFELLLDNGPDPDVTDSEFTPSTEHGPKHVHAIALKAIECQGARALLGFSKVLPPDKVLDLFVAYLDAVEAGITSNDEDLISMIRAFGEGPMTNPRLERSEATLTVLARLLRLMVPSLLASKNQALAKDYGDLLGYFLQCARKGVLASEGTHVELCLLLIRLMGTDTTHLMDPDAASQLFLQYFGAATNMVKVACVEPLAKMMEVHTPSVQMLMYRALYNKFEPPQLSVELSATFCMFVSAFCSQTLPLTTAAIYNLIEFSRFLFFVPYAKHALMSVCSRLGVGSSRGLLRAFRFDILKCWTNFDLDILEFPYELFGYPDIQTFLLDNYKELAAANIASPNHDTALLERLAHLKDVLPESIVLDGMALAIALAFTQNGIRNEVFKRLHLFVPNFKLHLHTKLLLVVYEIFHYTDTAPERVGVSISLRSALELLKGVVAKFHDDGFWLEATIHFLVRRFTLLIEAAVTETAQATHLRVLKVILGLGPEPVGANVLLLLIDLVIGCLDRGWDDVRELLAIAAQHPVAPSQLVRLYCKFFETPGSFVQVEPAPCEPALLVLSEKASTRLHGGLVSMTASEVESVLSVSSIADKSLLTKLLAHVGGDLAHDTVPKAKVVQALVENLIPEGPFGLWQAQYLADFHLRGGTQNIEGVVDSREYRGPATFPTSLGGVFEVALSYLDGDSTSAASVESLISTLKWLNSADAEIAFFGLYESRFAHIPLMDPHTCGLLHENTTYNGLVSGFTESLLVRLATPMATWTSQLLLAMINDLDQKVAGLFASFVAQVPTFAEKSLPQFTCYYVYCCGFEPVVDLLSAFATLHGQPAEATQLFINILMSLRIVAMKDTTFRNLFDKIDLHAYYKLSAGINLHKTALMLFEDFCSRTGSVCFEPTVLDVYSNIEDEDLAYGYPGDRTLDHALVMIERFGGSDERVRIASGMMDAQMSRGLPTTSEMLHSVLQNGMMGVSKILGSDSYEWAWKLSDWQLPVPASRGQHQLLYKVLKGIHDSPHSAEEIVRLGQLEVLAMRVAANSVKELCTQTTEWFQSLGALASIQDAIAGEGSFQGRTAWFADAGLEASENVLLARRAALELVGRPVQAVYELSRHLDIARASGGLQKMVNATLLLNETLKTLQDPSLLQLGTFQAAQTLWTQGNSATPVAMLKDLLQKEDMSLDDATFNIDKRLVGATLVHWLSESRQEPASRIMQEYVMPMADSVEDMCNPVQQIKVYELLAHFCEQQYKSASNNEMISKLERRVADRKNEIDEIKSHYKRISVANDEKVSVQKYYNRLKGQYTAELANLSSLRASRSVFRNNAVKFYLRLIINNDNTGEALDKFFSMFLEHSHKEELQRVLSEDIERVPSYKLIGWCTQLVSRLTDETTAFQHSLRLMVLRVCQDHPYHSLYHLVSLRKHEKFGSVMTNKVNAANEIWSKLRRTPGDYATRVLAPIERLCDESVRLAEYRGTKGRLVSLDRVTWGLYWLRELPPVPPPTMQLPVSHTGYQDCVAMQSMDAKVHIALSGLSLPKIATIVLSDGTTHQALFKSGTDDLRQDSIMEQVFEKVNRIFESDKETRKRHLSVRTYKAVPLGPQAGVIEFVANSQAFIDIVKPYHAKDKMKSERARVLMKNVQAADKEQRVKVYRDITSKISPCLRHFFFDTFVTPDGWFRSRTAYTRGTATNSMIGYILGLGDRHCNNILLDMQTGEPIHIDLGVAFDQGKRLPIPETVPFRLTRDIVDGFGVSGTQGSFSKSCEHTFRVLQRNKDHILAILDVLRWDPLYTWTISPIRKKRLQEEEVRLQPMDDASEAGTAVNTVIDKLTGQGLSVEATVRELIHMASSEENLALVYCGWSPFF